MSNNFFLVFIKVSTQKRNMQKKNLEMQINVFDALKIMGMPFHRFQMPQTN